MTNWRIEFDKKFPTHQTYGDLDLIDIKKFIQSLLDKNNEEAKELIKQANLELIGEILKCGELFGKLTYDDILLIKSEIEKE